MRFDSGALHLVACLFRRTVNAGLCKRLSKGGAVLLLVWGLLTSIGCGLVSREVKVPQLVAPLSTATLEELLARLNDFQQVRTLSARVAIQFQTEAPESGLGQRYRTADGRLILARPANVRLLIQAPLVKTTIAELASDGHRFQLLVYPEDHRLFVEGSNDRDYTEREEALQRDPQWREVGSLRRVRPQHITEALLWEPVDDGASNRLTTLEEFRQIEEERASGQKPRMVIRSYYIISLLEPIGPNRARILRKFWFDRTRGLLLVRQQVFGEAGEIRSEIRYEEFATAPNSPYLIPVEIRIARPYDRYSVRLGLDRTSLVINGEVSEALFRLEKPAEWGDAVRTINLDRKGN
ncbi:MAG: hypothetical protein N2443_00010 [Blastocatellia bacterium]|nr:hypothetical protein [Blastocatellia bacterium]